MARTHIENELDRMVQEWASRQPSMYSGRYGCVGHHIYSRRHTLLRWDLRNIAPLTMAEHRLLHDGKIPLELDEDTEKYLDMVAGTNYKNWLLFNGYTEAEFFASEKQKLKEALVDKYLYKSCKKC